MGSSHGQICGRTTVRIGVYDSAQKPISNVTFEMLGTVAEDDKFKEWSQKYGGDGYRYNFELPADVARTLAKSKIEPIDKDPCGKSVKKLTSTGPADEKSDMFGVCVWEGSSMGEVLVRISARGFVTGYYLNNVFQSCQKHAGYTLYRKGGKRPATP